MRYLLTAAAVTALLANAAIPVFAANSSVNSALQNRDDISRFHQALINTGVINELNENMEYTVFAPTNAAFIATMPRAYPCYYSAACRGEMAAVLRNHILPVNERVSALSKRGGDIPTIGARKLNVSEPYQNAYRVEGRRVLNQSDGTQTKVYRIDGMIVPDDTLARLRTLQLAAVPPAMTERITTTYAPEAVDPAMCDPYTMSGGYPADQTIVMAPRAFPDHAARTMVVTRTTTQVPE